MKVKIEVLNPVWSQCTFGAEHLKPILSYQAVWYRQGIHAKIREPYRKSLIKKGRFLTGFLPRIYLTLSTKLEPNLSIKNNSTYRLTFKPYDLNGIKLRKDQEELFLQAIENGRGIIKAPARSGKTVIAGALISSLSRPTLFLCHTKDLLYQTEDEFKKFGFDVGVVGGGRKELNHDVTIATHQSMSKVIKPLTESSYQLIIVDEAHHVSSFEGNYAKILGNLQAKYRIGFTATLPEKEESLMAMEGFLGPVIGELTTEEAIGAGIIVRPKVIILKVPENSTIKKLSYVEAYKAGIVKNRARNRMIMKTAKRYLEEDMTVLILVTRVRHGFQIHEMFNRFHPYLNVPFICGNIDVDTQKEIKRLKKKLELWLGNPQMHKTIALTELKEELQELMGLQERVRKASASRKEYKHKLNSGEIRCIIATNIWNEGINIPNLNVVINAAGGKSEMATIQKASRSLTAAPGKEYGIIVDLFDKNSNFFISHFGERVSLYMEEGWL